MSTAEERVWELEKALRKVSEAVVLVTSSDRMARLTDQQRFALDGARVHIKAVLDRSAEDGVRSTTARERDEANARFAVLWGFLKWVRTRDWTLDRLYRRASELYGEGPAEIGVNVVAERDALRAQHTLLARDYEEAAKQSDARASTIRDLTARLERAETGLQEARRDVEEYAKQWRDIGLQLQGMKRDRDRVILDRNREIEALESKLAASEELLRDEHKRHIAACQAFGEQRDRALLAEALLNATGLKPYLHRPGCDMKGCDCGERNDGAA